MNNELYPESSTHNTIKIICQELQKVEQIFLVPGSSQQGRTTVLYKIFQLTFCILGYWMVRMWEISRGSLPTLSRWVSLLTMTLLSLRSLRERGVWNWFVSFSFLTTLFVNSHLKECCDYDSDGSPWKFPIDNDQPDKCSPIQAWLDTAY